MKINCYTKELSAAVSRCASAANGQLPITKGVLLEAADGTVNVTGFNLELGVSAICDSKIPEAGSVVIEAKTLSEILKKLPGETVEIQADSKNMVQIKGGGAQYSIIGMSAEDFPAIQNLNEESPIMLPAEILKSMIRQTVFAVSGDNSVHSGVKFEIKGNELKLVACDGFRLAIRAEQIKDSSEVTSFIVPAKALSEVLKLDGEDILIYKQGNRASFASDRSAVFSNLLVGEFLDYKRFVPQSFPMLADVQTDELIRAIERVSIIITEKVKTPLRIHFAE
ncbi:MAG: DNA polymerase III subunit beta, partial [Clostridia bacterium]|nr:DNA polymerase III subunit beta [Clostridia bacterium]